MIPTLKDNVIHIERNGIALPNFQLILHLQQVSSEATNDDIEISQSSTVSTQNSNSTARLQEYTLPEYVRAHVLETVTDMRSSAAIRLL
ncbi:hypothetical protein [Parasitella parasitica]|uniref:Uncharacterized protein n=1 Tax=Parasitella parasitica TaxID=35722 RepID=A0A0B7MS46_9FUNG|nr:hypothetical protein [Parasitella parasitica]